VLILTAILLPVLLIMTSTAIDLGIQRASRRTMQARADVIALDLSRLLDGRTASDIRSAPATETAVSQSAERNSIARSKITVDWGTLGTDNSFLSGTGVTATAVKVTAAETTPRFFATGHGSTSRSAVATASGSAAALLGTKLATVSSQQSALLNGLLSKTVGGPVNLSAATYQGLLGSGVTIGDLATQLGFASPSELAGATVNAKQFYLASAAVLQNHGYTAAANVFNLVAAQTSSSLTLPVGKLMTIGAGGSNDAAVNAGFDALNLLQGSAYAINGDSAISIPNMSLNVAGLANTDVTLNVIQRPQLICCTVGSTATTSQASVTVTPAVSTTAVLGGLLGLATITGTIPLTESVAGAVGTMSAITCGSPKSISVGVAPQPVSVTTGLDLTIKVLGLNVAKVTTSVTAQPNGTSNGGTFAYNSQFLPPVGTGTMLDAPSTSLGLSGLLSIGTTQVTVLGLPIGLTLSALTSAINTALGPILSALDTAVTGPVAHALGLELAGADIGALNMTCNNPLLVG
jgi:uncharacterized membrane protein